MLQLIALRTKFFIHEHRTATAKVTNKRFALATELDGSMQQYTTEKVFKLCTVKMTAEHSAKMYGIFLRSS